MNREIKFRGMNKENNEWVYGSLVHITETNKGEEDVQECNIYQIVDYIGVGFDIYEDSIGQFTGLCDKNGVEIYEGDIVKYKDSTGPHTEIVNYEKGCFYAGKHNGSSTRVSPKLINTKITEVIGNIYENKELLEANNE